MKAAREESYFFLIKGYTCHFAKLKVTDRYGLITLENHNFSIFKILAKPLFPFSTLWHTHWGVKFHHPEAGTAFGVLVRPFRSWVRPKHPISDPTAPGSASSASLHQGCTTGNVPKCEWLRSGLLGLLHGGDKEWICHQLYGFTLFNSITDISIPHRSIFSTSLKHAWTSERKIFTEHWRNYIL